MAKANPKAYFPGHIASISYKKVDAWARRQEKYQPYFDTWAEAHQYMVTRAEENLKRRESEFSSAKRHLAKVRIMSPKEPA